MCLWDRLKKMCLQAEQKKLWSIQHQQLWEQDKPAAMHLTFACQSLSASEHPLVNSQVQQPSIAP